MKNGAIPKIFPQSALDASLSPKRKQDVVLNDTAKKARHENTYQIDFSIPSCSNHVSQVSGKPVFKSFDDLKSLLNSGLAKVPNTWWGLTLTPQFIIYAKWDSTFVAEKKIVIRDDLHIKV